MSGQPMHSYTPSLGEKPVSLHHPTDVVFGSNARKTSRIPTSDPKSAGVDLTRLHFEWNNGESYSDTSQTHTPRPSGKRKPDYVRVLYVDDEPDLLAIGKMFLERSGIISVETVESVKDGLFILSSGSIDVIVSDYQMNGMDGIHFLKEIRSTGNPIPFIIFTGKGREEVVIEALNEGADFYIQKGGEPKSQFAELENKICQGYRRHHAEREVLESRSLLKTVFESIADGILVLGPRQKIIAWNGTFLKMWHVSDALIQTRDPDSVLEKILIRINNPEQFSEHISILGDHPDHAGRDIFETCDGKYIEWYSHPHLVGTDVIGRILSFRDVTARYSTRIEKNRL